MKNDSRKRGRLRLERLRALQPIDRFKAPPPKGWVRALRDALGMTGAQLGTRIGVRPQTVEAIEKSEAAGTISEEVLTWPASERQGYSTWSTQFAPRHLEKLKRNSD